MCAHLTHVSSSHACVLISSINLPPAHRPHVYSCVLISRMCAQLTHVCSSQACVLISHICAASHACVLVLHCSHRKCLFFSFAGHSGDEEAVRCAQSRQPLCVFWREDCSLCMSLVCLPVANQLLLQPPKLPGTAHASINTISGSPLVNWGCQVSVAGDTLTRQNICAAPIVSASQSFLNRQYHTCNIHP